MIVLIDVQLGTFNSDSDLFINQDAFRKQKLIYFFGVGPIPKPQIKIPTNISSNTSAVEHFQLRHCVMINTMTIAPTFVPSVALRASRVASLGGVLSRAISTQSSRVAVLYQAIDPPVIGGVRKPRKPGGK